MPKPEKKAKTASKRVSYEPANRIKHKLGQNDVLLGRGNGIATFAGNMNFRKIVWMHKDEYTSAYRTEKSNVAKKVMQVIEDLDPPGRFLVKAENANYFLEVNKKLALEKTCQALREKKNKAPDGLESTMAIKRANRKMKTLAKKKSRRARSDDPEYKEKSEDEIVTKDSAQKTLLPRTPEKQKQKRLRIKISSQKVIPIKKKRSTKKKKKRTTPKRKSIRASDEKVVEKVAPKELFAEEKVPPTNVDPSPTSMEEISSAASNLSNVDGRLKAIQKAAPPQESVPTVVQKVALKELFVEEKEPPTIVDPSPSSMEEINSAANNLSNVDARLKAIEKAATPQESVPTESNPTEIDDMFSVLPPQLTAFFSGIFSNDLRDVNAEHPGALLPSKLESIGASMFGHCDFGGGKTDKRTNAPESPSTVAGFQDPPQLHATHSLFLDDEEMNDGKIGGPFKSWTDINILGNSHSLLN